MKNMITTAGRLHRASATYIPLLLLFLAGADSIMAQSDDDWVKFARLPEPLRSVHVTNSQELEAAVSVAVPGDHIVLADGDYVSPPTSAMSRNGTAEHPIVIRSETLLGARFQNSAGAFHLMSNHLILYGLDFVNTNIQVGQFGRAEDSKIWRCRFRDNPPPSTSMAVRLYVTDRIDIAYCEWVNWAGRGISTGIEAGTRNFTIRRNLFHDQPNQRDAGGRQYNATEAVQLGFRERDTLINSGGVVEYNRFVNWNSDDEIISVKTSNVRIFRNSFESCNGWASNRSGNQNVWEANEIRNCRGFINFDGPNFYLGNAQFLTESVPSEATQIKPGSVRANTDDPPPGDPYMPASENVVLAGNILEGGIVVGNPWAGTIHPVSGLLIRETVTPFVSFNDAWHEDVDVQLDEPATGYTWQERMWLEDWDVGPGADLPDTGTVYEKVIPPGEDATIYSESDRANGMGDLVVGWQFIEEAVERRILIRFEMNSLPDTAEFAEAGLELVVLGRGPRADEGPIELSLHRLEEPWNEGSSSGNILLGAEPQAGDSTWFHREFPDQLWSVPGGVFVADPSATISVSPEDGLGARLLISGEGMLDDLKVWLDDPASNHGWILVAGEAEPDRHVILGSRTARSEASFPSLTVRFTTFNPQVWRNMQAVNRAGDLWDEGGLGWLNIGHAPWIFLYPLQDWIFSREEWWSSEGGWFFRPVP